MILWQDNTILAPALPVITDDFHSLNDMGWYSSVYLLTMCATQILHGRLCTMFSIKWVYMINLVIFEIGSVVSAATPTSVALIFGRAITGIGAAGLLSGTILLIAASMSLQLQATALGILGGLKGAAAVAGPLSDISLSSTCLSSRVYSSMLTNKSIIDWAGFSQTSLLAMVLLH